MSNKYSEISFCETDYSASTSVARYGQRDDVDYDAMFKDIGKFIEIALRNGYQMKIWRDEYTISIEYNYQDENLGGVKLCWVGEDEYVTTGDVEYLDENKSDRC